MEGKWDNTITKHKIFYSQIYFSNETIVASNKAFSSFRDKLICNQENICISLKTNLHQICLGFLQISPMDSDLVLGLLIDN